MTENTSKMAKNDEKTEFLEKYRSFLVSKLEEAKAGYEYYNSSKIGNMRHKLLAERWKRKRGEVQAQLVLERLDSEGFASAAEQYCKHSNFGTN